MYIWKSPFWTHFSYDESLIRTKLAGVVSIQQQLIGKADELPPGLDREAEMDALIQNALQTSEIEGETLNVSSVRSSVARHLGLEQAGLTEPTRQTESLIKMLTTATSNLTQVLTEQTLCDWQAYLFPETLIVHDILIGQLRGEAPMQVVSRKGRREVVHFEAPPRSVLQDELDNFINWFNTEPKPASKKTGRGLELLRAGIAHLWLLTLHPFDDGNGRVARALTDRALAQAEDTSIRFYSLSAAIEADRAGYYKILEYTQSGQTVTQQNTGATDITEWLNWFLDTLARAMQQGCSRIERVINKTRFWHSNSQTILRERQVKVLNRLLDKAGEEFDQGINARKYQSLAKVSKATATRDLAELVEKNCLKLLGGGGRSTRYVLNIPIPKRQ